MKICTIGWICLLILMTGCRTSADADKRVWYDLQGQEALSKDQALLRLNKARIVLVGEHHNNRRHHQVQLEVIRTLHKAGYKVAVGMEMFRRDSQSALDQWVAGKMEENQFEPIFMDNWTYGWPLYRPIFEYAQKNHIAMVGLNVPRKVTAQVAYHGFASLNPEQKGSLEGITCNVTPAYRDFVTRAYGAHGHGQMEFNRFCEAQLVWDTAMAMHAIDYLERHPDEVMVLLAGSGHARKLGIPAQLAKINTWPYAVVLPETKDVFETGTVTVQDADYLFLMH